MKKDSSPDSPVLITAWVFILSSIVGLCIYIAYHLSIPLTGWGH